MEKFKGFDGWIEIFKGGKQTDSKGREQDGDILIDRAVSTFNPSYHEPPLTKGHPVDNEPSFGWVEGLKTTVKNGVKVLLAKFRDIVPEFEDMVKNGRFKKRSASFYPDGRLRHVGFLGAVPPAVKGLADVKFNDNGDPIMFEFAASEEDKAAQKARSKKYGIAIKQGGHVTKPGEWASVPDDQFLDPVNYRYPCPDADQTRSAASYWGQADNQAQYTPEERAKITARLNTFRKKFKIGPYREGGNMKFKEFFEFFKFWKQAEENPDLDMPDLFKAKPDNGGGGASFTEADIEEAKKEAAEAEREKMKSEYAENQRTAQREARNKEISTWCDKMVKEGKIAPAWVKAGLPQAMEFMAAGDEAIEFGEEKKKMIPLDWFKNFFENEVPKLVEFKEIADRGSDTGDGGNAEKREQLISNFMEHNKDASYKDAVLAVSEKHPDLFKDR